MWRSAPGHFSDRLLDSRIAEDLLDLVQRCRVGDAEAWRAFLTPFQEIGRRTLRSFRLTAADADDVLADALMSLYAGGLARFRGGTVPELIAFIKAVVRNRALDLLKERARTTLADVPDDRETSTVAHDECVEFLWQEVEQLKRDDRELFLMKSRGLKEREIAEQTGRPPGTIASQIARLMERLRQRLRDRGCL